jgi:hypothetical protein
MDRWRRTAWASQWLTRESLGHSPDVDAHDGGQLERRKADKDVDDSAKKLFRHASLMCFGQPAQQTMCYNHES